MKTATAQYIRHLQFFLVCYLAVLIVCLLIKASFTREEIYFAVNSHHAPWADEFFKYYTYAGDGLTTTVIVIILALFYSYRKAFLLLSSYAITSVLAQVLKRIFDMPRPKLYFADKLKYIHFVPGVDVHSVHSFPSGHAVTAFSTAIVLAWFVPKRSWGIALFLLAMLTAFSRMYLSQHFFEDVIAGSVIGVIITLLWLSWIAEKDFLQQPVWQQRAIKRD